MPAPRRLLALAAVLLLSLACMGMGGLGETEVISKIPQPDRPFTVTVIDVTDTSFSVSDFSVDGQTIVPADMGKARIGIDFAKVKDVLFLQQGDALTATVAFLDGEVKTVDVVPNTVFYGRTKWGLMRLLAKDIKELHF